MGEDHDCVIGDEYEYLAEQHFTRILNRSYWSSEVHPTAVKSDFAIGGTAVIALPRILIRFGSGNPDDFLHAANILGKQQV